MAVALALSFGFVSCGAAPSAGQSSPKFVDLFFTSDNNEAAKRTGIRIYQLGNLEYANVRLDGIPIFQVATDISLPTTEAGLRPIEERVIWIENNLRQIIATEFDLQRLEVESETFDDEVEITIRAEPNVPKQTVLHVTELDARLVGQPVSALADSRAEILVSGILSAKLERQQANLLTQSRKAAIFAIAAISLSSLVALLQRKLLQRWRRIKEVQEQESEAEAVISRSGFDGGGYGIEWAELSAAPLPQWHPLKLGRFNSLIRSLLRIFQVSILVGSVIWILQLFPQTRSFGNWLLGIPVRIAAFIVGISVARKVIYFLIDFAIEVWIDQQMIQGGTATRQSKRAPTIGLASRHMVDVIVYSAIAIFVLLEILHLSTLSILSVAGIAGLSLQSIIRDWIGGFLVLFEDQYAIGDVVAIENHVGLVEYLSLRVTKLRNLDGETISIANSRISVAKNLTNQWSRLNLGINVEYSTNLDRAIATIESVAVSLQKDPVWSRQILESPLVLGVDEFGQDYITIRLLIKTLPMRQWDVAREFRLRLKPVFDEAGIAFSFPLKTINMGHNPPDLKEQM